MNDAHIATTEPFSFDKIEAALDKLKEVPVTDEQALRLSQTGVAAKDADRYVRAQALSADLRALAQGEATQAYQSKCGDKSEAALAAKWLAELARLADKPDRLDEVLFALLPLGGGETAEQVLTRSRSDLTAALNNAVATNQIAPFPKAGAESLARMIDRLVTLRDVINLSLAPEANRLGQVILLADPRLSKVSALLDHALATGGFAGIEKLGLNRDELARLEAVQKLAKATDNNMPLVAEFMAHHAGIRGKDGIGPGQGRTIKPDALIAAAVAAPAELWEKLAAPAAPNARKAGSAAADPAQAETAKSNADRIAAKLRLAEPRTAMMAQFVKAPDGKFKSLATVLERHKGFDPAKQSAESFFRGKKDVPPADMQSLKSFQRLTKVAPAGDDQIKIASAVHDAGFRSAGQILRAGKIDFQKSMATNKAMTAAEASAIYCRAREMSDLRAELQIRLNHSGVRTMEQWSEFKNHIHSNASVAANADAAAAAAAAASVIGHAWALDAEIASDVVTPLSLADMFGSFDSCACSECQSVHSTASYLHNLLHWMKSDVRGAWPTLENRRPDIKNLKLSCANTHTMLPYIDIVTELLCSRITNTAPPVETTLKEPALRLQPEYRNRDAELKLAIHRFFPLSLPYGRSQDEGEAAFAAVGMSIHEAMEIFLPLDRATWSALPTDPTDFHLRASLGLNEWAFNNFYFSAPTGSFWTQYTGVTAAPGASVGQAMQAFGVEFEQLKELLSLNFVRKQEYFIDQVKHSREVFGYASIDFVDDHCSYDAATFVPLSGAGAPSNLIDKAICIKALRLLRLAKDTGYSVVQLDTWIADYAAMTNGLAEINKGFLNFLAQAQWIEKLTKVTIGETLPFLKVFSASSGGNEEAVREMFANLYGMRTSADVARCSEILGAISTGSWSSFTWAGFLSTLIEQLTCIFGAVLDTAKIPAWIAPLPQLPSGGGVFVKPLFLAIKAALFAHMDELFFTSGLVGTAIQGPLDRALLEDQILETVSLTLGINKALAQQVYLSRGDTWFDACHVAKKKQYPAAIPDLTAYMEDLWQAAMHQWLEQVVDACGCRPALADAVKEIIEPVSGTQYGLLNADFVLRLSKLRSLAKSYRIREELLVGALFGQLDLTLLPNVGPSWSVITTLMPTQDQLATLEQALKLSKLVAESGADLTLLTDIFAIPHLPSWGDFGLASQVDDNAAKLTKAIAADRTGNDRVMVALRNGMDDVRKSFRDALTDFTLREEPGFKNSDGIYKHLLLDPAMQPCMMTSRLVLATNSLQLLMHRAILNLETTIFPDADDKEEFEWRKNFRVWEANVKVLLYPENWIEPDLRLEQTPLFESAVAALSQDELNEEHCETVLYDYLSGLDKVARLDIRAFYRDTSTTPDTLHVFGRSWNAPYEYYYRRRTDESVWTPWDKIDIDIEGDHLIPVMFHRRLWLFWPIFVEKEHRDIKVNVNGEMRGAPYLEIRMAYTTFEHGRWRGKKLLGPVLEAGSFCGPGVAGNIRRKLGADKIIAEKTKTRNSSFIWPFPFGQNLSEDQKYLHYDNIFRDVPIPDYQSAEHPYYYIVRKYEIVNETLSLSYHPISGEGYDDYSMAGLASGSFFFWAKEDDATGSLSINIRREFHSDWETWHDGYTEMAYEDGFLIEACGASGKLTPATIPSNEPRIVARPYRTVPEFQNMVQGFDRPKTPEAALYAKDDYTHAPGSFPILMESPPDYTLTYPQQKDAMWTEPFFMADNRRVHFFERGTICKQTRVSVAGTNVMATTHDLSQDTRYTVSLHDHPYSCLMISNFNRFGIDGLYAVKSNGDGLLRQAKADPLYFKQEYDPGTLDRVNLPLPKEEFDFSVGGAYSIYNWELFFHLPTLIARQLKTEGRHKEAIRWLQLVFDPTSRESIGTRRVWRVKPFMTASTETSIATMVNLLSQGSTDPVQDALRTSVEAQIRAWRDHPFEPHKIAESRHSAYMLWCALEYVDVLIEWGDALFRQDSMESINEATNLYVLANEILGKRPTTVDKGSSFAPKSFAELLSVNNANIASDWSDELEAELAGYSVANDCRASDDPCRPSIAGSLFPGQYFCVPPNPKLPEFWDRVEDRLFKIRHCRNLAGEQRSLALFQPPIDPALLVRARAAGLSIEDVMAGLAEAQLPYRFQYLLGKAQDFTAEVKALGGQLLSAIEKKDAEELSQIRQTHEINIQRATRNLKLMSLAEAKEGLAALQHSIKGAEISHQFLNSREYINQGEEKSAALTKKSDGFMLAEQISMGIAGFMAAIPDGYVGPMPLVHAAGGKKLYQIVKTLGTVSGILGSISRSNAGRAATMGSYVRRWEDWRNQADQAAERIKELNRQLISAEIRIQTAEKDLEVFDQQVENSKEIYDYMRSKFSNEQLYGWMIGQLKTFHRGAYKLAAGMARQAQMAYKRELGDGINIPSDMLTSDHWDSGRAGLLAGEKLSFELKKLDDAYLRARANLTIYELSRTVSLRRLDPVQLFNLRAGGPVSIVLPEWLFQTDHNGRTLKDMRLKAVSISLPCTVGPNTRVPLQVRLVSTNPVSPAQRTIITSTAQGDSGRFDPNPNGETYLPFENENVSSTWEITLPKHLEFDPGTISDLIFNIRYTAQPAGIEEDEVQTTTLAQNQGRFGVSLRQDNYDGWLKLQRDLDTTIGHTCSEYFPNAVVTAATPYVYGSVVGAKSYYVVLADGSAEELSSQTVPDPETNSTIFPVGAVSGKREYNFKEIVDIVQVNSVTVP